MCSGEKEIFRGSLSYNTHLFLLESIHQLLQSSNHRWATVAAHTELCWVSGALNKLLPRSCSRGGPGVTCYYWRLVFKVATSPPLRTCIGWALQLGLSLKVLWNRKEEKYWFFPSQILGRRTVISSLCLTKSLPRLTDLTRPISKYVFWWKCVF